MNVCVEVVSFEQSVRLYTQAALDYHRRAQQPTPSKELSIQIQIAQNPKTASPTPTTRRNRRRARQVKTQWTVEKQRKYLLFVKQHQQLLQGPEEERRREKVNKMMALAVGDKTRYQCHSHHQKMVEKYSSIQRLIEIMTPELNKQERIQQPDQPTKQVGDQTQTESSVQQNDQVSAFLDKSAFVSAHPSQKKPKDDA